MRGLGKLVARLGDSWQGPSMTRESVRPPAVVRPASTDDADAITAVFLASRAAAMPYLTRLHDDDETR